MAGMIPVGDDNPSEITPVVTIGVIAICVAVFLWQLTLGPEGLIRALYGLGMTPAVLFGTSELPPEIAMIPAPLTLLTSMFMHGGWLHLIGNMLYLWVFGNNVEDAMGSRRFMVFYLLSGIAAALMQAWSEPSAQIPMVGASGAVSGVLGAYLLLYPHARVDLLVPPGFITFRLPASVVIGIWIAMQLLSSMAAQPGEGGTAWFAHIGGFFIGMVLILFFKRREVRLFQRPR
jgi:membrane associated rhomboid family serine protease